MNAMTVHPIVFYGITAFAFIFMVFSFWTLWLLIKRFFYDAVIFIDKSNRWSIIWDKVRDISTYTHNKMTYFLKEDSSMLNKRGKSLHIFSRGKPNPMVVKYNKAEWITSDSMMAIINNKLIQKLVQPSNAFVDNLILFGSIGGMIAGISCILILLKTFEVI